MELVKDINNILCYLDAVVDTGLDMSVNEMFGREYDPLELLAQNAFANTLATYIADPVDARGNERTECRKMGSDPVWL